MPGFSAALYIKRNFIRLYSMKINMRSCATNLNSVVAHCRSPASRIIDEYASNRIGRVLYAHALNAYFITFN